MAKKRRRTLFREAKYAKYGKIVSFKNPSQARKSATELRKEFKSAMTRAKKLRIARVAQNASNRAYATTKRKKLSAKERREYRQIGKIYDDLAESFWKKL